jgi:hypothetical protein
MKRLGGILILVLVCSSAFGQTVFGLKAGLNLAALRVSASIPGIGSGSNTTDKRTSFCAGLFVRSPLGEKGSLQTELLYSSQGGGSTNGSPEIKVDYIISPIMFRYHTNEMVTLQAGPQLGFLVSAETAGQSISSEMNSLDLALNFGVGFEFAGGVDLSFRYVLGLTNAASNVDTTGAPPGTTITMNNQVMQFALGFKLSK